MVKYRVGSVNENMVKQLNKHCKNTKICFRIVPMMKMCWEHVKILDDKKTLLVRYLQDFGVGNEMNKPSYWPFETDGIFYNNTQVEIYDNVVPELIENLLKGRNAIILCFGQTGTGKSLTSLGVENSYEDRGIIPRLISDLFLIKNESRSNIKMTFNISYIESTKSHVRDLLKEGGTILDINSLRDVSSEKYSNEHEMLKAIFRAEGRKSLINTTTYRSNAANSVLTILITSKQVNDSSLNKTFSKIHIVDLAGADNFGNKSSLNKTVTEIGTANLAKSQLEQFLLALIENIPEHIVVKQRLNILINYLKDSLNTNSMLRFIGHIRTNREDLLITLSMLRFGQILRGLKSRKLNYKYYEDEEVKIKNLEIKLKELKTEKEVDSMIRNEDLKTNLTQGRISHIKSVAEDYLHNKTDELTIISLADIYTVLEVFKNMFTNLENEHVMALENAYKKAYDTAAISVKNPSMVSQRSGRRNNQLSKESLLPSARQMKTSKRSLSKRSISKVSAKSIDRNKSNTATILESLNKAKSRDSLGTDKSLKRSRTSSRVLRKSISSRRKSSLTSDSQKDRILEDDFQLPDKIPSYTEAWNSFTINEVFHYTELKNQMNEYEADAKQLNRQYVDEIKKLQELRNRQDDCQNKLLQTQMQQELSANKEVDEDGYPCMSEQELVCMEILSNYRKQVVQQQERVLSIQAELLVRLQLYQDKKKLINENFESYCNEKYKTLVPILEETVEDNLCKVSSKDHEEELSKREQIETARQDEEAKICHSMFSQYEKLKSLTYKQHEKILHDQLLNKKWIRSCKK